MRLIVYIIVATAVLVGIYFLALTHMPVAGGVY